MEGKEMMCRKDNSPVIIVERLQLREVTIEGGDLLRSYAPECPNFEDFPCCNLSDTSAYVCIGL